MKRSAKITAFLLVASLCTSALFSCGDDEKKGASENTEKVVIVDNGKTEYKIIRSDLSDIGASAAAKLRSIMETITDDRVELSNDFEHEKLGTMRTDFEILAGPTNRDESSMHEREFTYLDYAIDMDTTRLSLTGGSSQALVMAAEYIGESFIDKEARTMSIPKGTVYEYYHDYPIDSFTIGGKNIEEYVFVAAQGDKRATSFANSLLTLYGKTFRVEQPGYDDVSECEIILSSANDGSLEFPAIDDFAYMYKIDGTKVYIGAYDAANDEDAWNMFVSDMLGDIETLNGDIEITDCERTEYYPHAERSEYTEEIRSEVDARAEALKNEIMNSTNLEIPENAAVYYVSPNGDDSRNGKSPENAWRTLSPVNNINFPEGTYILFERGGIWRGQIKAKAGVTYSAYGDGEKPALYGGREDGAIPEKWTLMEGTDNIWIYADKMIDSGTLIFNHGEQHAYKEIPGYIDGKFVNRKAPETEFDIIEALDVDLDFFHKADSILVDGKYPKSGEAQGEIYLRCDAGNPGEIFESIEFVPRRNGFAVSGDNVTIDNFTVKYIGAHGVGSGTRKGLTVTNCEFGWIGGGIQSYAANGDTNQRATRFGNAIEIYGGCDGFDVNHCYIYQVYDAGITHQFKGESASVVRQDNVSYSNNLIENCVYSIEYFLDASENPEQSMHNVKIYDNIMRWAGFGWGNQRPDKGSQSHIKGWTHDNPAKDFEIYNNILDRSANWMIDCGYDLPESEPKIYDNTFIQYSDGLFGKYSVNPPKVVPYDNTMLADERLFDNTFYFIDNQNVKKFTGDKGTLTLHYNGMPIFRDGDYIELHGEKITDNVKLSELSDFLDNAVAGAALFTGFGGEYGEGTIEYDGVKYDEFVSCKSWEELESIASTYFDTQKAASLINAKLDDKAIFVTKDDVVYRYGGYVGQYAYTDAEWTVTDCYMGTDDTISILVHITSDDPASVDCDTIYKLIPDETGAYKFNSSFALPIELVFAYPEQ